MNEWIKCSERLPKVGMSVVVWRPGIGLDIVEYSEKSRQHLTVIRRDGQWWDDGRRITHWMPLPDPPEERP